MSLCNGLCDRLAARMHSGGWEPPHYKRLKPELLSALEGEVVEIGPGFGREHPSLDLPPGCWPGAQNVSASPMGALTWWSARSSSAR
jgi:hypothetical protein